MSDVILQGTQPLCKLDKHNVAIYELSESITICVVQEKDLHFFSSITEELIPFLVKCKNRIVINFQAAVFHKDSNENDRETDTFFRSINGHLEYVSDLKEPNFLTGVSAGGI